jgi:hypothetical protein
LIRVSIPDDHRAVLALPSLAYAAAQSWRFDLDQRSVPNPPAGAIRKRRSSSDPERVGASTRATAVERNGRGSQADQFSSCAKEFDNRPASTSKTW